MRKRSWIYVILMTVTLLGMSMLMSQVPAQAAAVNCSKNPSTTADTDGDGFTDFQECNGITLADGSHFKGFKEGVGFPRSQYLDPNSKDLFVMLVRATSTFIQENPPGGDVAYWFGPISNPVGQALGQYGLGVAVHLIPAPATGDRTVCPGCTKPTGQTIPQRAVKVTESLDRTDDNILGYTSSCGTPNGPDLTTIYTQKIVTLLGNQANQDLIHKYIRHTIVHEIGHVVGPLAPVNNPDYGPYHYQSADNGLIMDQSVYQEGNTFYVGEQFTSADQTGVRLK